MKEGGREVNGEQKRNTEDARCCLVWSSHATGHNSSQ